MSITRVDWGTLAGYVTAPLRHLSTRVTMMAKRTMIKMIKMMVTMMMIINWSRVAGYVTAPQRHFFTGDSTLMTMLTIMMIVSFVHGTYLHRAGGITILTMIHCYQTRCFCRWE